MYRPERMPLSFPLSLLELELIETISRKVDPCEFPPVPPEEEAAIIAHIRRRKNRLQQEPYILRLAWYAGELELPFVQV